MVSRVRVDRAVMTSSSHRTLTLSYFFSSLLQSDKFVSSGEESRMRSSMGDDLAEKGIEVEMVEVGDGGAEEVEAVSDCDR
jgi:hypothetical protein